jgi:hypothetical protein
MHRMAAAVAGIVTIWAAQIGGIARAGEFDAGTPPATGLTNGDVIKAFGNAVMDCLQSRMGNRMIKDLGNDAAIKVLPATAADKRWAPSKIPSTAPVWITAKLGYDMNITEPSPDRCEVLAMELPVDRTFRAVAYALTTTFPDFKSVPVKPGYNPIVYQFESSDDAARYIVHMEGAEPGLPGHAFRFSLLFAYVQREPAAGHAPKP